MKTKRHTKKEKKPLTVREKLRDLVSQVHLWLGLASGLVVFVVSLTGAVYVFQKEISQALHPSRYFMPQGTATQNMLPFETLRTTAEKALGASSTYAYVHTDGKTNSWFMARKPGNPDALTVFGATEYFKVAYINPYTGTVTDVVDMQADFFNLVKLMHWSLLLNTKIGQPIVGWGTAIFVLLMITGVVLWWPKWRKKKSRDQALKINFKAKWKRLNFELHNVLGFYSLVLSLIIAITGLVYSFKWVRDMVYLTAQGSAKPPEFVTMKSDTTITAVANVYTIALTAAQQESPDCKRFAVNLRGAKKDAPLYLTAYNDHEVFYNRTDYQFDAYTGKLLHALPSEAKNRGEQLLEMNYDIHVGTAGGMVGKIIAFMICIICTSLPVTGFLYWWYRKKFFQKKKVAKHTVAVPA